MKRKYAMWAAVALVALLTVASGAEIVGPDKVEPYRFVDLKSPDGFESAIWELEPADKVDQRTSADGKTLTFVAPPGQYKARVILVNWTTKKLDQARKTVTIGDAKPPDPPSPPDPPVPGGKYQVVLFIESGMLDDLTAQQRILASSLKFKQSLEKLGHRLTGVWDPNLKGKDAKTVPPERVPWFKAIEGKSGALLAIAPMDGGDIQVFALPSDQEAVLKLLGGGK